ncbi:hypothetical protein BHE74_00045554 [Ensete ventricosum]|nr:hypothetical protein GW17_00032281 [Ensete ventricosum]RWW48372.1 hypothetical protein BHE74_00045554 [Ensete ventricosum]RZR98694.1 hypothetical protein BHM03_00028113 [Ensete ventricosum]
MCVCVCWREGGVCGRDGDRERADSVGPGIPLGQRTASSGAVRDIVRSGGQRWGRVEREGMGPTASSGCVKAPLPFLVPTQFGSRRYEE